MQSHPAHLLNLLNGDVQYVIPRWQRRYCWGQEDIERLIEDIKTVAASDAGSTHYVGTLLTLHESVVAGTCSVYRVVDGQQRLTTISILLACILETMLEGTSIGEWTKDQIRSRLFNPNQAYIRRHKLKLQEQDDAEYVSGLDGKPSGSGAVAQAWRITKRLIKRESLEQLMSGLMRLQVVSIGLNIADDPQQIFESINATGRPLTESEKIKNWLLIGLPEDEQNHLCDHVWSDIEHKLDAKQSSQPIDIFFRDFLRWQTGEPKSARHVYDEFRRWAIRNHKHKNRYELCRELQGIAKLYGLITGTAGNHKNKDIERELEHLRAISIDVHRPFTLRLLYDSENNSLLTESERDVYVSKSLSLVSSWITRIWLAGRDTKGLANAFIDLAHHKGGEVGPAGVEYWRSRICNRRGSRIGVPTDEEVRNGVATRIGYGGSSTKFTFAVFCSLMQKEHKSQSPEITQLTIEHVMPQTLTKDWKVDLGENAEAIHAHYKHRLGNLTLCGDEINSLLGAGTFEEKRPIYGCSTIGLTRRIKNFSEWNEEAINRRSEQIAESCLALWPWIDENAPARVANSESYLQWRIVGEEWHHESSAAQMVLNLVCKLLQIDPENENRLSGEAKHSNVHLARKHQPDSSLRLIPNHEHLVIDPYARDYTKTREKCAKLAARCGVEVELGIGGTPIVAEFWQKFKEEVGSVPGQKESWKGSNQWSPTGTGDYVGIAVLENRIVLYIKSGDDKANPAGIRRMRLNSEKIRQDFTEQEIRGDVDAEAVIGRSVMVANYQFVLSDKDNWSEHFVWLKDQHDRLQQINQQIGREVQPEIQQSA